MRSALGTVLLAALAGAGCALTPDMALRRMGALNHEALAAYQKNDLSHARAALDEAVSTGKSAGLENHEMMARTYLHLGAVQLQKKERAPAARSFSAALRIQPDIQVTPSISTPALRRALAATRRAQQRRRRGGVAAAPDKSPPAEKSAAPEKAPPPPPSAAAAPAPRATPPPAPPAPVDDEPDLPATVSRPLHCVAPDEAAPGEPATIRCVGQPGVRLAEVSLHFRAPGSEAFTAAPMTRSRKGWWSAAVPGTATTGRSLQYYVEARPAGTRTPIANGQPDSPNLLLVAGGESPASGEREEDDPLEELALRDDGGDDPSAVRRPPGRVWLGLGLGSGYGWHPRRTLEWHDQLKVSPGFDPGALGHATGEIGYQVSDRLALSLQARLQYIPESGSGDTLSGGPRQSAFAVLARAQWLSGEGRLQTFLSAAAGAGQGFRLYVGPRPADGLGRSDTLRGGPLVLGPGAGLLYHFGRHLALAVEARALLGLWELAALGELAAGLQASF